MNIRPTDLQKLAKVNPDLVRVVKRCAKDWSDPETGWIITCGIRTIEEQRLLVAKGASKTMRSRHLPGAKTGLSHAVDFACTIQGKVKWDWNLYCILANRMKAAAAAEKVRVEWGGSWKALADMKSPITSAALSRSFADGPHYQLPWVQYPG
jgi:peptidoglycan LD-endopeptidase CwlK